jgi:hypothetical protein
MKLKSNPTKTVLTITVGFLVVYFIAKWQWALSVAGIIGLAGLFSDFLAEKIEWLWMKITWILSLIVPNILLSLLFFLFLFPIALLMRITSKKNFLQLKNRGNTTWIADTKVFDAKSMENPW